MCSTSPGARRRRARPWFGAAFALALASQARAFDAGLEATQPLAEALRHLSSRHALPMAFSGGRVPADLRVGPLPAARDARELRDALLARHGLSCRMLHSRCVIEAAAHHPDPARDAEVDAASADPPRLPRLDVQAPSHYTLMRDDANFMDAGQIAATPHLADDVFRLARAIPGVAGGDIAAPFHVRGGQQDELALRLDGLELYRPFHLHNVMNALGVVDSNLIGGIDVHTGVWPSRFGGRTSAVMDIRSREIGAGRERRLGLSAINAYYTHAQGDDAGRHATLASVRRGYLDLVLEFVDPGAEIDPGYHDVFLRHRFQPDESHALSLQLLRAGDRIVFEGDGGEQRSDGESDADYAWLRWDADWSDTLRGESLLAWTGLDQRRRGFALDAFESNAVVDDARELHGWRIGQRVVWDASERLRLDAGGEWRDERSEYAYFSQVERYPLFSRTPERFGRALRRDVDGDLLALWLDAEFAPGPQFALRAGARATRYRPHRRDDSVLDPQFALSWQPTPTRRLGVALGRSSQSQRSDELAVEDGEQDFFAPERATLAALSWEERVGPALSLRAELFVKRWNDPRPRYENLFEPIELFPETESDRLRIDPERADARGIELGLDRTTAAGRWWLRYAWLEPATRRTLAADRAARCAQRLADDRGRGAVARERFDRGRLRAAQRRAPSGLHQPVGPTEPRACVRRRGTGLVRRGVQPAGPGESGSGRAVRAAARAGLQPAGATPLRRRTAAAALVRRDLAVLKE
jgi:hypothetical protein